MTSGAFWQSMIRVRHVGFARYQLMHRSLSGAMVCYLSDLYVDPATRGSGIDHRLIVSSVLPKAGALITCAG